jgi:hypothetical protein
VDTLNSSLLLLKLRNRLLLEPHPYGSNHFYTVLDALLRDAHRAKQPRNVGEAIARLGVRFRSQRLREVISLICRHQNSTIPAELARGLQIRPENLITRHLSTMVESGALERRVPDRQTLAEQADRATRPSLIAPKEHVL